LSSLVSCSPRFFFSHRSRTKWCVSLLQPLGILACSSSPLFVFSGVSLERLSRSVDIPSSSFSSKDLTDLRILLDPQNRVGELYSLVRFIGGDRESRRPLSFFDLVADIPPPLHSLLLLLLQTLSLQVSSLVVQGSQALRRVWPRSDAARLSLECELAPSPSFPPSLVSLF